MIVVGSVFGLRAEAGSRPAASHFLLCCQKKVTKEKAILLPASFLLCFATSFKQLRRIRSQSMCALAQVDAKSSKSGVRPIEIVGR